MALNPESEVALQYFKYIFCILVYRNYEDLVECITSIDRKISSKKIVVVNSFYDDESDANIESIAREYNCDFISCENKGYSYGNNRGIEYINEKYNYDYVIISNPDIVVEAFDDSGLARYDNAVIAPLIHTKTGKAQNPYWFIRNKLGEYFLYKGMKHANTVAVYGTYAFNKIIREIGLFCFVNSRKKFVRVYAAHGSFCMIPKKVIDQIGLPYDENMFLFVEEALLAHNLQKNNIKTYLTKDIKIFHKEDGSIRFAKIDEMGEVKKSVIYYYESIHKK